MAISNTANLQSNISSKKGDKVQVTNTSNILKINNINTDVIVTKSAQKDWAIAEEVLTITTNIQNNLDFEISDFNIKDTLSIEASFVPGTVKIGSQSYADVDPITGFTLPISIAPGSELDMTYDIKITKYLSEPAIVTSTLLTITSGSTKFEVESNELSIDTLINEIFLLKEADLTAVKAGDTLTYTITISNNGTLTNTELFFTDSIPEGTTFVENSVKIDDVSMENYNPETGFNLKDLNQNESIKVEFKVIVN